MRSDTACLGNAVMVPIIEHIGKAAQMRPLRIDGKPDEEKLTMTVKILLELGIPRHEIRRDWYILLERDTYNVTYHESLNGDMKRYIVHHPDILIVRDGTIRCVLEVDGSVHDSNRGKRRTEKRNSDYWSAKLSYIVLNEADLKYLGMSWRDFLWESLLKMGLI